MNRIYILILLSVLFTSCSEKEVEYQNLQERNSLVYEVNKDEPYTGKTFRKLPDGTILLSGAFNKGKKNGEWIEFARNGQRLKVQNYKNGNYDGVVEEYNKKGQILTRQNFKESKLNGAFEYYFKNGSKKMTGEYRNEKLQGTVNEWYKNGNQKSIIVYSNGKKNGAEELFSENGQMTRKASYIENNLDGKLTEYYSSGKPKKETEYKNGKVDGKYLSYYENGHKQLEYNQKVGSYVGIYTEYNEDESVHRQYDYQKTKRINIGTWKKYWNGNNPTKSVKQEYSTVSFDKNGKPSTPAKFYYSKGKLKAEINFSSIEPDVLHGKFTTYYKDKNHADNSRIYETGEYLNGKLNGSYTWYSGPSARYDLPNNHSNFLKTNKAYKVEATYRNGSVDGRVKLWRKFYHWGTNSHYRLPIYLAHDYSNGQPIHLSNGYGIKNSRKTFSDRHFDKNNNPIPWQEVHEMERNAHKNGKKI